MNLLQHVPLLHTFQLTNHICIYPTMFLFHHDELISNVLYIMKHLFYLHDKQHLNSNPLISLLKYLKHFLMDLKYLNQLILKHILQYFFQIQQFFYFLLTHLLFYFLLLLILFHPLLKN